MGAWCDGVGAGNQGRGHHGSVTHNSLELASGVAAFDVIPSNWHLGGHP